MRFALLLAATAAAAASATTLLDKIAYPVAHAIDMDMDLSRYFYFCCGCRRWDGTSREGGHHQGSALSREQVSSAG